MQGQSGNHKRAGLNDGWGCSCSEDLQMGVAVDKPQNCKLRPGLAARSPFVAYWYAPHK